MDALEMMTERRSVRAFKPEAVDRALMTEIVELSRWAPSWCNYQVARYTLVDDSATIERLMNEAVNGFTYNMKTLKAATGVAVLSYVQGKSGKLDKVNFATSKENSWEIFDAGIACQTFCLAAHAKGIGTCILGVIDDAAIAQIVALPEGESAAALIVYGHPAQETEPTPRLETEKILRFI